MTFEIYSEELLRRRPRGEVGWVVVETVDSTNRLARRVMEEYARESGPIPMVNVLAWSQTGGRGRGTHRWMSPPGLGVYATLVRTHVDPLALERLPLQTAVALCTFLSRRLEGRCRIKWPNDLMVGRSKLGGILIETVTHGSERTAVIIGFGVNCFGDPAVLGEPEATSLEREGASPVSLAEATLELVAAVDAELGITTELIERYVQLSRHELGETLRCRLGDQTVVGTFLGFDPRGFLRLEIGGAERQVSAGEIIEDG